MAKAERKPARATKPSRFTARDMPNGERRLFAQIADLRADARNARVHPARQIAELRQSYARFGQVKAIVVDASGKILAGHGFLEAMRLENALEVLVEVSTLDALAAKAYAIADNRTAELAEWDTAILVDILAELGQLDPTLVHATGFDDQELAELLADLDRETSPIVNGAPRTNGNTQAPALEGKVRARSWDMQDRPPLLGQGPAIARRGDVWAIGPHRLACGDCRDRTLVASLLKGSKDFLMLTDPPYCSGSSQEAGKAAGTFGEIAADNLSAQGFRELISQAIAASGAQQAYVFTDWKQWPQLVGIVEGSGLAARAMIVWDKGRCGIGAFWRPQHELILFATRSSSRRAPGSVGLGNVLAVKRARNLHHYTEKSVELLELLLRGDQATGRIDVDVYDPFVGSGSTILAAAKGGRSGFGIEVEPQIVDTALRRLRDAFQVPPVLMESTPEVIRGALVSGTLAGGTFDELARVRLGRDDVAPTRGKRAKKNTAAPTAATQEPATPAES